MAVLPWEARNAGKFCIFVAIGMAMGAMMIMYMLSSEQGKGITSATQRRVPGKLRQQKTLNNRNDTRRRVEVHVHRNGPIPESEYFARKKLVEDKCKRSSLTEEADTQQLRFNDQFIVDDEYKIIYCWVPKVASGNWKRTLVSLRQSYTNQKWRPMNGDKNSGLSTFADYRDFEITARLESYFKFLFVRHPLERLLSAFRNRFESYAHPAVKSQPGSFSTFGTFVNFLSDSYYGGMSFNIHWRPVVDLCKPCQISYDFIGHYETLHDDFDFLSSLLHFRNTTFPDKSSYATGSSDQNILRRYYSNLTANEKGILYKIYADDFDFFNYEKFQFLK
ncbi:carbohydrate sulfotransferase 11-like [Ptychodera flava]|uniref:carbohydrate sulfotransferase 11-like n=1 Tax=Ptychodera flava TaxID=63121 RepID=UPI003969E84D